MTDDHIVFVIYSEVMVEEWIQLPFLNPQIPNSSCLFLFGIHRGGAAGYRSFIFFPIVVASIFIRRQLT